MRKAEKMAARLGTGIVQPADDWPGIFIRGDDALAYASRLRFLLAALEKRAETEEISADEISAWSTVSDLADLLQRCRAKGPEQRKNRVSESRQNREEKA
jgi:hypothetical protein